MANEKVIEAKELIQKLLNADDYGENPDAERLYELIEELAVPIASAVEGKEIDWAKKYDEYRKEYNMTDSINFLVKKVIASVATSHPIPADVVGEKSQEELWNEVEAIFDKHTMPTGGGYEADYTDRQSFFSELQHHYTITKK